VGRWKSDSADLAEREINAIRDLQSAVMQTNNYIGRLENGEDDDRDCEEKLANLLADSALAFKGINDKIIPLLQLKALSWSRPQKWIEEQVVEAGIPLSEMNDLLLQLSTKE